MASAADFSDDEMREKLSSIATKLESEELEKLKFIFRDALTVKDKIKTAQDLFDILCKRKIISRKNMASLVKALELIQSEDAIDMIETFYREEKRDILKNKSCVSEFTSQLYKFGSDMNEEDVEKLAFCYKIKQYNNRWELLILLSKKGDLKNVKSIEKVKKKLGIPSNERPAHQQEHRPTEQSSETAGQNVRELPDVPEDTVIYHHCPDYSNSQYREEPKAVDNNGQPDHTTTKKMRITEMKEYFEESNTLGAGGNGTVYKAGQNTAVVQRVPQGSLDYSLSSSKADDSNYQYSQKQVTVHIYGQYGSITVCKSCSKCRQHLPDDKHRCIEDVTEIIISQKNVADDSNSQCCLEPVAVFINDHPGRQHFSDASQNAEAAQHVPQQTLDYSLPSSEADDSNYQYSQKTVAVGYDGQPDHTTTKKMRITEMKEYFDESNKLGAGGNGTVYKGCKQYNDCDVIVNVLHNHNGQEKMLESFKMEMISSRKKHPFLLPLLAYCDEKQGINRQCILMYPYMKNKDLDTRLKEVWEGKATLLLEDRVRIMYQVSAGLKFLHQKDGNNGIEIIHRDVKASNILLDDMLNARLSDPRIARELGGQTHVTITSSLGTPGYVDPDVTSSGEFRPINDVFGLGVVMLQLLLNKPAQIEVEEKGKTKKKNLFQIHRKIPEKDILEDAKKQHKDWPEELLKKFVNLAWRAIAVADDRITLDILSEQLRELLISARAELWKCPSQLTKCVSCFGQPIEKLKPHSPKCNDNCARFCMDCLSRSKENPLFCPQHGECQPPNDIHISPRLI